MNQPTGDELIQAALDAQKRAFCPYSNFPVGAAIANRERQNLSGRQRRECVVRPDDLRRTRGGLGGGGRGRPRVCRHCHRQPRRRDALRSLPAVSRRVQSGAADRDGRLGPADRDSTNDARRAAAEPLRRPRTRPTPLRPSSPAPSPLRGGLGEGVLADRHALNYSTGFSTVAALCRAMSSASSAAKYGRLRYMSSKSSP